MDSAYVGGSETKEIVSDLEVLPQKCHGVS